MNVLLLGSGAREHAILVSLLRSPKVTRVFISTTNAGMSLGDRVAAIKSGCATKSEICDFCTSNKIDLVVVGSEALLVDGIADALEERGIKCFGPSREAAKLEGSKAFMKEVCVAAGVQTAKYITCSDYKTAILALENFELPVVIKADGLAGGKGVVICDNIELAHSVILEFLNGKFGNAGKNIIIEEFLDGKEVSFFAILDGTIAKPFLHACDYKRINDGNIGSNTGGMGSFAPSFISKSVEQEVMNTIIHPMQTELQKRGISYKGVLFAGLMITLRGIYVLEFNCRFGDPETQSILPLLETDITDVFLSVCNQTLADLNIKFSNKCAVTVVASSKGYPESSSIGDVISGLSNIAISESQNIFHAGTKKLENGDIVTNGGRVLCSSAIAETINNAREIAYTNLSKISFDGMHYRTDIANDGR